MELTGKTVLLTGATGGLGRAIAKALAERGARLIVSSRKSQELDELAVSLPGSGHRTIVSDLAQPGAGAVLLAEAGPIDVLVANAALPASGKLDSFTAEQVDRALRVNLEVPVQMTRELIPAFTARGSGHFVYISSISGKTATARASLYAATKFGLRGFALCLRDDLRPTGVGVSVVSPGAIGGAGMFADSGASAPPLIGAGTPEQVGTAVVTAIERNRGEVTVAPLRQRALARFAANAP
ncbi:MAG: SDR family oxidoreductase, partial [Mycobacteriaceae bacterium]|nr:SDR family oxidoreductase [Mycobacteriaceae bacterium]